MAEGKEVLRGQRLHHLPLLRQKSEDFCAPGQTQTQVCVSFVGSALFKLVEGHQANGWEWLRTRTKSKGRSALAWNYYVAVSVSRIFILAYIFVVFRCVLKRTTYRSSLWTMRGTASSGT